MNVMYPQDGLLTPERPRLRKNTSKFSLKSLTARVQTGTGSSASTSPASTDSRKGYHSPPLSGRLFHFPPSPPSSPLSSFSGLSSGSPSRQRTRGRDQGPPPGSPSPLLGPSAFLPPLPNTPGTLRSMGSFCVDESVRGAVKGKAAQLLGEEVVPSGKAAKVLGMEKKASYSQPRRRSSRELEDETSGDESDASIHVSLPRNRIARPGPKGRAAPPPALKLDGTLPVNPHRDAGTITDASNRPDSGSWTVTSQDAAIWQLPPDFHTISEADAPPSPASYQFPVSAYFEDSPIELGSTETSPKSNGKASALASPTVSPKSPPRRSPPTSASPTAQYAARNQGTLRRRNTAASTASRGTRRVQRGNALQALEGRHAGYRSAMPPPPFPLPKVPMTGLNASKILAGSSFLSWSDSDSDGGGGLPVIITPPPGKSSNGTTRQAAALPPRQDFAPVDPFLSRPIEEAVLAEERTSDELPLSTGPPDAESSISPSPRPGLGSPIMLRGTGGHFVDSSTSDSEDEGHDITSSFPTPPMILHSDIP